MSAGIRTENLTKVYSGSKEPSLDKLSITVDKGEIYGFLGANGAGKSTTIRLLLNFLQPTSGAATILGKDSVQDSVIIKNHVGYLAGDVALYERVTGEQLLRYLAKLQGMTDLTYLTTLSKRFEAQLNVPIGKLSKGNRQKIGVLQACMHQPDVLILDEPTSGLDPLMQERFYETMFEAKDRGAAVFLSSHNFGEVQRMCDRIGIIRKGKLVREGTLSDFNIEQLPVLSVTFAKAVPAALQKSPAIEVLDQKGRVATLKPRKAIAPFLKALGAYDVVDLHTTQQELEEEFMSYYQEDEHEAND
jgi:ABC-2 type transport system ATP-binding protein